MANDKIKKLISMSVVYDIVWYLSNCMVCGIVYGMVCCGKLRVVRSKV